MSSRGRGRASASRGEGGSGPGPAGRSGARSRAPVAPSRPPHESTLRDFFEDQPSSSREGQFDNAGNDAKAPSAVAQATPIEGNASNIEQTPTRAPPSPPRDIESSSSSINPNTPDFSPPNSKLNPSAPVFSPSQSVCSPPIASSSKLNPTSPDFSPSTNLNGGGNARRTQTHRSSPAHTTTTNTTSRQSTLNPRSGEFVPKTISPVFATTTGSSSSNNSSLNVSAPAFVPSDPLPTGMQNGKLGEEEEEDENPIESAPPPPEVEVFNEDELLLLTPKDILAGVQFPVDLSEDVANESILKAAAEVLIKMTVYPGSFERGKVRLEHTVNAWTPTESTLSNLAEMLIHWGILEPSLRLSVSRICQVLCEMDQLEGAFRQQMVLRLGVWFGKRSLLEKFQLVNFSLFFAEIFSRIRTTNEETPVKILGDAVLALLTQLLAAVDEKLVISACHILKLTGPLLVLLEEQKIKGIISTLERLTTDETLPLSKKCVEIMIHVIELNARGWGNLTRPLTSHSVTGAGVLNQYMMTGAVGGGGGGEVSVKTTVPSEFQAPVSNPEEWSEFLDDDNQLIEDHDPHTTESFVIEGRGEREEEGEEEEGEEEIDEEMEKEFEFFVQDLEEHLLNVGELDPEQLQEQQQ